MRNTHVLESFFENFNEKYPLFSRLQTVWLEELSNFFRLPEI